MITQAQLDLIVARIVNGYAPDAIGLFGSYALATATDRSDLDLVVIKRTRERPSRRSAHVRHLIPMMNKLDVVVLTPEELAQARTTPHTFHNVLSRQLKVIYVAPGVDRAALGV
jgi:predicted nucleotidyltransferase